MPRSLTVLGLCTVFVVLVGVTVGGVIENWPDSRTIPSLPSAQRPKAYGARVVALRATHCRVPGIHGCSIATVRLSQGPDRGRNASFHFGDTGGVTRLALGDRVSVTKNALPQGAVIGGLPVDAYAFVDFQRGRPLLYLALAFALLVIVAGRFHGLRALIGLGASLATVVFFIVPAIADGKPPLQVAAFGGLGVMLLTIPLVHGGGAKSLAACLGTAAALLLTLGLANLFTHLAHLSGLTSDQALYLQTVSHVSIRGLLLAGMVIGALGVLGDTTVTQASTVIALRRANPSLGFRDLVTHATSVGRDHIAATVNTLVLAYTGAALPTLIIISIGGTSLGYAVTTETIAEAVVATLVGSIGIIAAVPATTALAALLALHLPERSLRSEHAHVHAH